MKTVRVGTGGSASAVTHQDKGRVTKLLAAALAHLREHDLPQPVGVDASTYGIRPVSVHLSGDGLAGVAAGLAAWADSMGSVTVQAWRTSSGDEVHLRVFGLLDQGVQALVYDAVSYPAWGEELDPNTRQALSLEELRALATGGGGTDA